jgi:hypothetical protein
MPEEPKTTMTVFVKDRAELHTVCGSPTHLALRKLLTDRCPHPELSRRYTTALVRTNGAESLNSGTQNTKELAGFYCRQCKTFVFPHDTAP